MATGFSGRQPVAIRLLKKSTTSPCGAPVEMWGHKIAASTGQKGIQRFVTERRYSRCIRNADLSRALLAMPGKQLLIGSQAFFGLDSARFRKSNDLPASVMIVGLANNQVHLLKNL